ncbi:MAG: hypothetical protein H0V43_11835 [Gemmatimonadales bacterium]|nr:hypothetical protein [Gemmatimonadales bacterium]
MCHATMAWAAGDEVLVLGGLPPSIGASEYLAFVHERLAGAPPPLDLDLERRVQLVVREAIAAGETRAAHDCGLGGLAVAVTEMALAAGIGFVATAACPSGATGRRDEALFGESASRVVVACRPENLAAVRARCAEADVPMHGLGRAEGEHVAFAGMAAMPLAELRAASEAALGTAREDENG